MDNKMTHSSTRLRYNRSTSPSSFLLLAYTSIVLLFVDKNAEGFVIVKRATLRPERFFDVKSASQGSKPILPRVISLFASVNERESIYENLDMGGSVSVWEVAAKNFVSADFKNDPQQLKNYVQVVTLLRVGIPALLFGATAAFIYPALSLTLAAIIDDYKVFGVIAQDNSQYIQNILTTCGLTFSILVGQTYYFMYQQQEEIYYALFDEVTVAKSLLEQVALVCQGRKAMYKSILECINIYVQEDLLQTATEPAVLLSSRPIDDPFERVMFLTSVGEPSIIYKTVRTLRQARARRLGALQKKLPPIHMVLLYSLAAVVLCTFPVLGAGVQTIGGLAILKVQSWYLAIIVFGIAMTLGIVNELRQPSGRGAYNVVIVLSSMVQGLEEELEGRMSGKYSNRLPQELAPTVDANSAAIKTIEPQQEGGIPTIEASIVDVHGAKASSFAEKREWIGKRLARRIRKL